MRWFASFWVTVALCLVGAFVYWLSTIDVWVIDDLLNHRLVPSGLVRLTTIPLLVGLCYALVRGILHRVLAYTESAIDASPRAEGERGRRRAAIGNAAYVAFGNPTGWWLAPFALVLGLAAAAAGALRWSLVTTGIVGTSDGDLLVTLLLVLAILYATTVGSAMLFPDRPQPLRALHGAAADPDLDPILGVPDEAPAAKPAPRRGLFGRKTAGPSSKTP